MKPRALSVFMLEDDHDDRFMTRTTLSELGYDVPVTFLAHSDELFAALEGNSRPDLILMDYNSTPEDARQVLHRLKADERVCDIPVVVLVETVVDQRVRECYRLGASSVIQKPSSEAGTRHRIKTFFDYWLATAAL